MSAPHIINRHGFFSDYWLGSLALRRETRAPALSATKLRRLAERVSALVDRVDGAEAPTATLFREKYARPLLEEVWGFKINESQAEEGGEVRILANESGHALLCLALCPGPEILESREARNTLEASLARHQLPYGFLLSPSTLRLIRRPGQGNKGAALDVDLAGIRQSGDTASLETARRLLHAANFAAEPGGAPLITDLEQESLRHRAKVSAGLKDAVFSAAEIAIKGFISESGSRPATLSLTEFRDAGLLTLYRLLFILYAESRDDRLSRHRLYRDTYSLESLVQRIQRDPRYAQTRNRYRLWGVIQGLFAIFDQGMPAMPGLDNIPPRGGTLFSPATPAGQLISSLRLSDADVTHLLLFLATSKPRRGVGRERISYRELAIEHLGSVYEGLLEFEPRLAAEVLFAVRVLGREYILPPAELIRLVQEKDLVPSGADHLVNDLLLADLHPSDLEDESDPTDEPEDTEEPAEEAEEEDDEAETLKKRSPAKITRRLEPGEFYFAPGGARKSSGSFYTVEEIVDYLSRHALGDHLAHATPEQILDLRVIDLACGSAHFLVGAARVLGQALLQAHERARPGEPPVDYLPRLTESARRERWAVEAAAWCKRKVVECCLYGVDLNPTAVQLAQVALWIESLAGDRPLSFFEHHIRCGNSLLGGTRENLFTPPVPSLQGAASHPSDLFDRQIRADIARALTARQLISAPLPTDIDPDTPAEYRYKADRLAEANRDVARARLLFDLRCASAFVPAIWSEMITLLSEPDPETYARTRPWWETFVSVRNRERFFHWELEFPEIFQRDNPGFDVILGNPPWDKVKPDRKEFYGAHDVLIRIHKGGALDARIRALNQRQPGLDAEHEAYAERVKTTAACLARGGDYRHHDWVVNGKRSGGDPDLFKFFIERAHQHLRVGGHLGYLVPSAVYNTDGCTGIRHLLLDRMRVQTFFGLENRWKIFEIDSRYKFVCLVAAKIPAGEPAPPEFPAVFMRLDVEELRSGAPAESVIPVRRREIEEFSPGTLALLEFRSRRDREIVLKMAGLLDGQTPRPHLGGDGFGSWGANYYREFDMTNDRGLWTQPDGRLWTPREVCGLDYPGNGDVSFDQVRAAMAERGFWPLYEGKHIDQWLTATKPLTRWLSLDTHQTEHQNLPDPHPKLVFRDIARNTDERTCIAAVLPPNSSANNKLPILQPSLVTADQACSVLNSLCFDYLLRFRVGSTINWTYISKVQVPTVESLANMAGISSQSAAPPHPWAGRTAKDRICLANRAEQHEELWRVERAVAEAYGLNAADFAHVLTAFPVMARKRAAYHAFLVERTEAWRRET